MLTMKLSMKTAHERALLGGPEHPSPSIGLPALKSKLFYQITNAKLPSPTPSASRLSGMILATRLMAPLDSKKPPPKKLYKKIYWNLSMTNRHKTQKFGSSEGEERNWCRCSFIQMKHGLGNHTSLLKQSRRGTWKQTCTFTRNLQSFQISTR